MNLGISIDPRPADEMREYLLAAEESGIDLLAFPDSQLMYREVYSTLGMTAERTETPHLATLTTNPITRHVTVTAGAIATIDELSGGRAILGIARGDSAVRNTELDTPSLSEFASSVEAVRELLDNRTAEWRGTDLRLEWSERDVPIFVVGEGPKTLSLGGRIADGVFYGGWNTPDRIDWARSRVAAGAGRGGAGVDDVEFWSVAGGCIDESRVEAINQLEHVLSATAHITSKGNLQNVPDHLVESFREHGSSYRSDLHNQYEQPYNAELLREHGLREFMAEHWTVAGTPSQVVDQLRELHSQGVDGVVLLLRVPDPLPTIEYLGDEVIPQLPD